MSGRAVYISTYCLGGAHNDSCPVPKKCDCECHHGGNPLTCPNCSRQFATAQAFGSHRRNCHPSATEPPDHQPRAPHLPAAEPADTSSADPDDVSTRAADDTSPALPAGVLCLRCGVEVAGMRELLVHLRREHPATRKPTTVRVALDVATLETLEVVAFLDETTIADQIADAAAALAESYSTEPDVLLLLGLRHQRRQPLEVQP